MNIIDTSNNDNYLKIGNDYACMSFNKESRNSTSLNVSQKITSYMSSLRNCQNYEEEIHKFIESKYQVFEFAPAFETTCLNIIKPDSLGFKELEMSNILIKNEKESSKRNSKQENEFFSTQSQSHSSQFKSTGEIRQSTINSNEFYKDDSLSQAFSSCSDN